MEHPHQQVHSSGPIRVSIDGPYALSGGADGVVALHLLRRFPTGQPLWARQCHTGAVTCVRLHSALRLAVSCGRDGSVILHENIIADPKVAADANNATTSNTATDVNGGEHTERLICRVTGELRTALFDAERRRVFIAGDSLRCLQMSPSGSQVRTIPMCVPSPVVALALSSCGSLLAVASASCTVGVVSVCHLDPAVSPPPQSSQEKMGEGPRDIQERANRLKDLRIVLPNALTPAAKRDDAVAYRLTWCTSGSGSLFLLVPRVGEVRVLLFEEAMTPPYTHRLRHVGTVDSLGLTDLIGVACHPLSTHMMAMLLVSGSGTVVGKVDARKWSVVRIRSQNYTGVADAEVDPTSGDVVVGTLDGRVTYMKRETPKALVVSVTCGAEGEPKARRSGTGDDGGARKKLRVEPSVREGQLAEAAETGRRGKRAARNSGGSDSGGAESDDGFIVADDSSDADSDCGLLSSRSSAVVVEEDLRQVVADLKRSNPMYDEEIVQKERPSRWRRQDPREMLRDVEVDENTDAPRRSVFLDDEAEESSGGSGENDEEAERGEDDDSDDDGRAARDRRGFGEDNGDDVVGVGSETDSGSLPNDVTAPAGAAVGGTPFADYFFQVGATPSGEEGSCYLAYNSVGYIHCTAEATTVHFHDMSLQAVRILERGTMLMASLSPVGAAFVIAQETTEMESVDDMIPRLTIYYRTFIAIGLQPDWRLRLHPGEVVRCLTTGVRYTAVATSRYLRIFSLSGLELAVISLFPRIVAMVGTNSKKVMQGYGIDFDPLAVCYLDGGGELRLQVLDVGSRSVVVPATVVPVTVTHQLQWMGWSEDGPLHIADTAGVLQMFTQNWGGSWVPVYDPRCMGDQTYNLWIWGVCDESMLVYRSCKSDPPYPAAVSGGLPTERVPLFVPLLRSGTERDTVTWDHLLRREVRTDEIKRRSEFYTSNIAKHDMLHDRKIMELFSKALADQQTSRAVDLATFLELRDNIELCAKEANAKGHAQLVQKLLALLEVRVKSKKKRRCPLPLEGSVVSERERDMLLRKLLVKEKVGTSSTAGDTTGTNGSDKPSCEIPSCGPSQAEEKPEPVNRSCVAASEPTRRRVTFDDTPELVSSPGKFPRSSSGNVSAVPSKPPTATSSSTASKAVNPFSKRPLATKTLLADSRPATTVGERAEQSSPQPPPSPSRKPVNPFNRSAKITTTMVDLTPSESSAAALSPQRGVVPSSALLVLGDPHMQDTFGRESIAPKEKELETESYVMESPQTCVQLSAGPEAPRLSSPLRPAAAASVTHLKSGGLDVQSPEAAANSTAGDKGSVAHLGSVVVGDTVCSNACATRQVFTGDRCTTGDAPTSSTVVNDTRSMGSATGAPRFIPKVQPVLPPNSGGEPFVSPVETMAVDPFLDMNDSNLVSLDSMLLDVGHESSPTFTPRSASFGAALLKRYRDEEEESSNGSVKFVVGPNGLAVAAANETGGGRSCE